MDLILLGLLVFGGAAPVAEAVEMGGESVTMGGEVVVW